MPQPTDLPRKNLPLSTYILSGAAVMAVAAFIELAMGRAAICKCGYITLWAGDIRGEQTSQQIADWYSFSHVIHGFILYGFFAWLLRRRLPIGARFFLAVLVESCWEVLENSPFIIDRYRQTMADGYLGDSVVNSMSDILFCVLGFWLARSLRPWMIITLAVLMELGVGHKIHDNLTLNVIMLVHPFGAIKHWQMSGV